MLLRFFRSTGAQVLVIIPLMGLLLWLPSLLKAPTATFFFDKAPMPLYKFVTDVIPYRSFIATMLTLVLVILQGFLLVRLNTRFIFINNRTYLPALFFILLTASVPNLQRLNPVIFSGFFLLLALEKIYESYSTNKVAHQFFVAAFYLATGTLFYPFLLFFMVILWISLVILKPFNWREWLFTILGFFLPMYFTFSYYYLVYNQPFRLWNDFLSVFTVISTKPHYPVPVIIFMVLMLVLLMLAIQFMGRTFRAKKILPRKAFAILMWLFVNAIVVYLLVGNASAELIFLGAVPVSYLLAHYFALIKSEFFGNIFLLIILVLLAVIQLLH
jgi:hypothetical protein